MYEKLSNIFKKTWSFIVGILAGIVSMLFINRSRNSRAKADIEQLRDKLQEYTKLVQSTGRANQRLTKQLEQLTNEYNILRRQVDECEGNAAELDRINIDIGEELNRMEGAIAGLRDFIDKYGE